FYYVSIVIFIFFFQAEDGIRDRNVTGVQTCALPILAQVIQQIDRRLAGATDCLQGQSFSHRGDLAVENLREKVTAVVHGCCSIREQKLELGLALEDTGEGEQLPLDALELDLSLSRTKQCSAAKTLQTGPEVLRV